jgi:radical S-adenosyl methionine domain-containing protein 2
MITTVNYHLLKACNFKCKFCYATFEDICTKGLSKNEQFQLIEKLAQAKLFKKINFAGGEPTLVPHIKELIQFSKSLGYETSLVTNGSRINGKWIEEVAPYLDILALSIDSIDNETNLSSGRNQNGEIVSTENFLEIANFCHIYGISLKINTVVFKENKNEYLADFINQMKPFRWKILQVTRVEGQNDKQFDEVKVSKEEFYAFCEKNKQGLSPEIKLIPEANDTIQGSYLMVDMLGRFYDSSKGCHSYSQPILNVGVQNALKEINVSHEKFIQREGNYSVIDAKIKVDRYEKKYK